MASVTKELEALTPAARIKELEAIVIKQQELIDRMRASRFTLPTGQPKKAGSTFLRVIIPDSHGAHINKKAAKAFLNDLEWLKPSEVVGLGDHLDCGGFLAQHHTLGFLPETAYTFEQDCEATNTFLDAVQARCAPENFWYIVGNHEHRIEKWIIEQTIRNPRDSSFLKKMFGLDAVLGLSKRGINIVERDKCYHGLKKRGTIKLGKCHFHHGTRCGVNAAKRNLDDLSANIAFGHIHRIVSYIKETANGIIGSWCFGCLCELHPMYGDTNTSDWAHGYGLQIVGKNGEFMTVSVPIIDGCSYLSKLLEAA